MGVRHVPAALINVTQVVVSPARATLWTRSTGRKAIVRKVIGYNNTGAAQRLLIGTCANDLATGALTQVMPDLWFANALTATYDESDLPEYEFVNNIFAQLAVAVAPANPLIIQVEIEEY